jgi:hypothetical protein
MQRWVNRALTWAPPLLALVFLATVLLNQGEIRESLNSHADFASAPVIAQLMSAAPDGRTVLLGDYAWYEALWLLRGTQWLPGHFLIWQLIPFVLWLLTAAFAGLAVRRIASRWAAILTVSLVICAGLGMRNALWSLTTHGPVAVHVALLGLALIVALQQPRWLRGWRGWVAAVVVGLITAVGATDQLVALCGVGSLLFTALLLWLRRGEGRVMGLALVVSGVAMGGAMLLIHWGEGASIIKDGKVFTFAASEDAIRHLELLPPAVSRLVASSVYGSAITKTNALMMAAGIAALVAMAVVLWGATRLTLRSLWPEQYAAAAAAKAPAHPDPDPDPEPVAAGVPLDPTTPWLAAVLFFGTVLLATLLAWVFTSAVSDQYASRYLVAGWLGVCVLIPLLADRANLRWLASLTATLICLAATVNLIKEPGPVAGLNFPTASTADQIEQFAKANDVTRAYGGFWDAMPITWHTRFGLKAYPIKACEGANAATQNCQFYLHTISSWYDPAAGRTMLLTDPTQPLQPVIDPRYGKPVATKTFGTVTATVYEGDISPYIGPR